MSEKFKEAWGIVFWSVLKASGAALIPIGFFRVPLLTSITSEMAESVMEVYGYESLRGLANFVSVAGGVAGGVKLANEILEKWAGVGTAAASISTATIHIVTGAFLILACEMLRTGDITDEQLQDTAFCKTLCKGWVKNIGKIVIKLMNGQNPAEAAYL